MAQRSSLGIGGYKSSAAEKYAAANMAGIQRPGAILGAFGTDISTSNSHANSGSGSDPAASPVTAYGGFTQEDFERGASYESTWPRPENRSGGSSTEDLVGGLEPSFLGVVMSPRRTLRVINRD